MPGESSLCFARKLLAFRLGAPPQPVHVSHAVGSLAIRHHERSPHPVVTRRHGSPRLRGRSGERVGWGSEPVGCPLEMRMGRADRPRWRQSPSPAQAGLLSSAPVTPGRGDRADRVLSIWLSSVKRRTRLRGGGSDSAGEAPVFPRPAGGGGGTEAFPLPGGHWSGS